MSRNEQTRVEALTWLAGRIRWEQRLAELHAAPADDDARIETEVERAA